MKKSHASIRKNIKQYFDAGLNKRYHRAILKIGMGKLPVQKIRNLNNGIVVIEKRNWSNKMVKHNG